MNWNAFNTHNDSFENAFESFSIQLFEHYLRREYPGRLKEFYAISGSGGDGGVEAYGVIANSTIGLQAKWFRTALTPNQVRKIRESILTAKRVRPEITEYIICLPKRVNSKKTVKENKIGKSEQEKLLEMEIAILAKHTDLKITWWFENSLLDQLEFPDCQYIESYWFGKNFLTLERLKAKFKDQKEHQWLKTRYAPDLNAEGKIAAHYDKLCLGDQFKLELSSRLSSLGQKLTSASELINNYIDGQDSLLSIEESTLRDQLKCILMNFSEYRVNINILTRALENQTQNPELMLLPEYDLWKPKMSLERIQPTNIQRPVVMPLAQKLEKIHQIHIPQYLNALKDEFRGKIKIFFGPAGTGKTQGLAYCTSQHLDKHLPAIIIPAKATPCSTWTEILSHQLELPGKAAQEILTALEALSFMELRKYAELQKQERSYPATVLINVDGLEEDTGNWEKWYDRINDTLGITTSFPTVRFMFSAREYFRNNDRIPEVVPFEQVQLPTEGDISVSEAADIYFSPIHFNISNVNTEVMKRLESLYALKLFCERYSGVDLAFNKDVHTDLQDLLSDKIDNLDREFKNLSDRKFSSSSTPVSDSLLVISQQFYTEISLERTSLLNVLDQQIPSLSYNDLEMMLDFLSERGVLTTGIHENTGIIKRREIIYYVSYQSIIEHVISEDIIIKIIKGEIDYIPAIALNGIINPLRSGSIDSEIAFPNETMTESILKRIFLNTGRLVGENGYLTAGMQTEEIVALQMEVLAVADDSQGPKYEHLVKAWLTLGHWHQQQVFIRIVRPASKIGTYFNPRWFHNHIMSFPSVYDRDRFLWADRAVRNHDSYEGLESAIYPFEGFDTSLYPFDRFDQEPLIYVWCLSSPNRSIRKELRSSLLNWANLNVTEWIKLLDVFMNQLDSQIWEDLASITLGLSHILKDISDIELLSKWTLDQIFANPDIYKSSRVREGFRGIVDRAMNLGALSTEEGVSAKPQKRVTSLLPLATDALKTNREQFFPIVSDLAWYVLDNSYEHFLDEVYQSREINEHLSEQQSLLRLYAIAYDLKALSPKLWAQATAIELIRNKFGYQKKSENLAFLPSHGEKGVIMYFAEKYVWQAVYSIQGYLSEQLPLIDEGRQIKSYLEIVNMNNPAEDHMHHGDLLSALEDIPETGWHIPENLVNSVPISQKLIKKSIKKEIEGPSKLKFPLWLEHTDKNGKIWRHIYSNTTLTDKNKAVYGRLTLTAIIMEPNTFIRLLDIVNTSPEELYFLTSFDTLHSIPSGNIYQNPSDVFGGTDLDENEAYIELEIDGINTNLHPSIVKIIQLENNNERYYYLPSKVLREITGISQIKGRRLTDHLSDTIGFVNEVDDRQHKNSQVLTCIGKDVLDASIENAGYRLVWFIEVFKRTTLNVEKDDLFLRRTRKYMAWIENGVYKTTKLWDKDSSN